MLDYTGKYRVVFDTIIPYFGNQVGIVDEIAILAIEIRPYQQKLNVIALVSNYLKSTYQMLNALLSRNAAYITNDLIIHQIISSFYLIIAFTPLKLFYIYAVRYRNHFTIFYVRSLFKIIHRIVAD